ncbi:MAG TPA: cobalamin-dependent protein [Candidatus Wallbacteria bacterium]|nr:cobalamin-dependent protein [Candidatus Wallbacteria bacterium]
MSGELCAFINKNCDMLAEKILYLQYSRQPGLAERYAARDVNLCMRDIKYHLSYLSEALNVGSVSLFLDYISWAGSLLDNLKLPPEDLIINIECMKEVLAKESGRGSEALLLSYLDPALAGLKYKKEVHFSFIKKDSPYFELASKYLTFLVNADRVSANKLILEAIEGKVSVKDLYLHVFQATQREIGRMWHENKISVACEHFCTAATQQIIARLYPHIFSAPKNNENKKFNVVAACVANELHEIGLRMIADFLEIEGYNTYFLGANVPKDSIVKTLCERNAHMLALSATMTFHVKYAADIIKEIKNSPQCSNVKVIVGGYPFNVDDGLWKNIMADGYAADMAAVTQETARLLQ